MCWGILFYIMLYNPKTNKVSINCIESCKVYNYTREELIQYSQSYRGINPLYEEALKYFPKEKQDEKL